MNLKPLLVGVESCAHRLNSLNLLQKWTNRRLTVVEAPAETPCVKQQFWAPPLRGGDPRAFLFSQFIVAYFVVGVHQNIVVITFQITEEKKTSHFTSKWEFGMRGCHCLEVTKFTVGLGQDLTTVAS